ncbi:RNA polymerase sigma factor SigX [Thalassobacillus hwangdonensis]|uniref:RNA polymerase sigma factor SigX n=1 Tax=Thalassobacillus hwangdonensis TaxID=546108 RepID=A0ABW3KZK7_9BACI
MDRVFERLYDCYHHDLYQFVFYMVKNKEQTEDLIQEIYIKVMNSYDTFQGKSSEKTWLFSIARHVTIDFFRAQKRKRNRILDFFDWKERGEELKDSAPIPEDIAMMNEEIQKVYHCLDQLNVDQRSVIILRFIQEHTLKETAELLGWSVSKVKTTQHRAMKLLKERMEKMEEGGIQREA